MFRPENQCNDYLIKREVHSTYLVAPNDSVGIVEAVVDP